MATELWDQVEHRFADSDGVKIHYAALGQGPPLVVMIHGFPDFLPHPPASRARSPTIRNRRRTASMRSTSRSRRLTNC